MKRPYSDTPYSLGRDRAPVEIRSPMTKNEGHIVYFTCFGPPFHLAFCGALHTQGFDFDAYDETEYATCEDCLSGLFREANTED